MILTEDRLHRLLDKSLAELPPPAADFAVVLEGSIAEGFGNPSSDVDFLLITPGDEELPTMPSLLFVDGRRVEIRTRSRRQLAEQFRTLEKQAARPGRLDEDLLNRCQRLLHSHPLRGHALVDEVKALMPRERFSRIAADWWAHRARQCLRHALALLGLGLADEAVDWNRAALVQTVKAWAAGRGETYLEPKWLPLQLDRAGRPDVRDRYEELRCATPAPGDPDAARAHLTACLAFATGLGLTGVTADPGRLTVERAAGVTTWQTGERIHVIRRRREVFALGDRAGAVWRSLVPGRSLPDTLTAAEHAAGTDPGPLLAAFWRYGLIRLAWKGGGTVTASLPLAAPPGPVAPPPSTAQPLLSVAGAAVSGPDAIDLMPLPADRFAAATMALVWSNVVVENAVEDLTGALRQHQWPVAELTARRAVHAALRGLFSAHGVHPLPADCDLVHRMDLLPAATEPIRVRAGELLRRPIDSPERGETALADLRAFITLVRDTAGADAFPLCFDSADDWRATLELGHDWLRIGAHLNAQLPIEEARDLLAGHGTRPHQSR
ncbi:DNA polymerase III subunit beta [Streptomyces sp. F-3]|uniref:Polymerase nucleotidyl transferase domain-containing protein n=1 Tax=Streptomyces thermogriseus TaxID=75292 RepID=A0ABP4DML1_9ACTN|nr:MULTISPECIES: nucleotidyltransferase domain-containing protein [Streptomyces]MDN5385155.1 nucleotidyltransferase domain-containing protein [Streptomyces sp. LB8]GAT84829.1 DNA polymerase III subunit beta [Streptomyces sp. F-3]